jgi:hypothetical protein
MADVAHLAGGSAPTGAITFTLYGPDDASCSGAPVFEDSATVSGDGDYPSAPFTPTEPGTYRWRVSYSGDAANASVPETPCGDATETVTAVKASPTFSTTAGAGGTLGGEIADTGHLEGGSAPSGTISFSAFGPDDEGCTGAPAFTGSIYAPEAGSYGSPSFEPEHAGIYHWVADYSGDAANVAVGPTPCGQAGENALVAPARPTIFSLASGAASPKLAANRLAGATGGRIGSRRGRSSRRWRAAGLPIHDTVRMRGGVAPGGFILFSLYGPGDVRCSGTPVFTTETEVTDNGDYVSQSFVPTQSGTYRWVASYSGDSDNSAVGPTGCGEPAETVEVIVAAEPAISSTASGAVTLGGAVHDTAHLSGGSAPTGAISFQLYPPSDADCSGAPAFTSIVPVSGNGDYGSAPFTPGDTGTYRWVVEYSGDARNASAGPSECGATAEIADVRKPDVTPAVPALSTTAGAAVSGLGTPIYDVAHLSGGASPRGSISFTLYGPEDPACTKPPAFTSEIPIGGAGDYPSALYVAFQPGTYHWVASYSGDFANAPAGPSGCGDTAEALTVSPTPTPNPNVPGGGVLGGASVERAPAPRHPQHPRHRPRFTG